MPYERESVFGDVTALDRGSTLFAVNTHRVPV
jgi:hypothetical protein